VDPLSLDGAAAGRNPPAHGCRSADVIGWANASLIRGTCGLGLLAGRADRARCPAARPAQRADLFPGAAGQVHPWPGLGRAGVRPSRRGGRDPGEGDGGGTSAQHGGGAAHRRGRGRAVCAGPGRGRSVAAGRVAARPHRPVAARRPDEGRFQRRRTNRVGSRHITFSGHPVYRLCRVRVWVVRV
jgi:hypothetical protein